MTEQRSRPGRKAKFSEDEVRRRMIEEAQKAVISAGVSYGLDSVRLDHLSILAGVPRGAAYNAFSSADATLTPQENLRRATIISILRNTPGGNAGPTYAFAVQQMARHTEALNSGNEVQLRQARAEMVRTVAMFNHELLQSARWRVYRSLVVTASTNGNEDPEILAAIQEGEENLIAAYSSMFQDLASAFHLRPLPGLSHRHFAMAVYGLNEGLANRSSRPFLDQMITVPDETAPWSLFALAFDAILDRFYAFEKSE